ASDGDLLALDEIEDAVGIDVGAGQNQTRAGHHAGVGEAPGVGVEHGSDGKNGVVMADGKAVGHSFGKGMQDDGAVRVDDAFGESSGAGSEAHSRAGVFVELWIFEIVVGFGKELLVVQKAFGDFATAVGDDDDALKGNVLAALLVGREKNVVDEQKA